MGIIRLFEFVDREVLRFYHSGFEIETEEAYPWEDELPLLGKWIPFGTISRIVMKDLCCRERTRGWTLDEMVEHWGTVVDDRLRYSINADYGVVLWKR